MRKTEEYKFTNPHNLLNLFKKAVRERAADSHDIESEIMHRLNSDVDPFQVGAQIVRYNAQAMGNSRYKKMIEDMDDVHLFHHYVHVTRQEVGPPEIVFEEAALTEELQRRLDEVWLKAEPKEKQRRIDDVKLQNTPTKEVPVTILTAGNMELLNMHNHNVRVDTHEASMSGAEIVKRMKQKEKPVLSDLSTRDLVDLHDEHRSLSRTIKQEIIKRLEEN